MLVTVDQYQEITGDTTTATALVAAALADSQHLLEERLGRGLELDERTERVRVFPDGASYPRVTPLVTVPDGTTVQGSALLGVGPSSSIVAPADARRTITYSGGYDPDEDDLSAATFVPVEITRAIAWAAYAIAHPADFVALAGVPAGATSASVGDVSLSWGPGGKPETGEVSFGRSLVRRYRWRGDMAA